MHALRSRLKEPGCRAAKDLRTVVTPTRAVPERQFDGWQRIVWRMTHSKCKAQKCKAQA
jgi:hypothetical protein